MRTLFTRGLCCLLICLLCVSCALADEERDALRLRLLDLFRVAGSTPEVSKARTRLAMLLM